MITITRYNNRKMYRQGKDFGYVTGENIAQMLKDGHKVKVIAHQSNEDLTLQVLTQALSSLYMVEPLASALIKEIDSLRSK